MAHYRIFEHETQRFFVKLLTDSNAELLQSVEFDNIHMCQAAINLLRTNLSYQERFINCTTDDGWFFFIFLDDQGDQIFRCKAFKTKRGREACLQRVFLEGGTHPVKNSWGRIVKGRRKKVIKELH